MKGHKTEGLFLLMSVVLAILLLFPEEGSAIGGAFVIDFNDLGKPVGFVQYYKIKSDKETVVELAIKHDLGYNEIVDANPGIDPWYPGKGTEVVIPTSWIVPSDGVNLNKSTATIVVNLAEMRLYFLKQTEDDQVTILTFPIGIGKQGTDTPLGYYRIIQKMKDPVWYVPESIRKEDPSLPAAVPPGPDNPLGKYALRLSNPSYLIHGTNKPLGIGRRVSHGCLRMYPEDIELLYRLVNTGDQVLIIYEPVKIARAKRGIYIEVHRDYKKTGSNLSRAVQKLIKMKLLDRINEKALYNIIFREDGIPHFLPFKLNSLR